MPGEFVDGMVPIDFSNRDKDDSGIYEIRKMPSLKKTFKL